MTLSEQFWWDKTNNAIVYRGSNPNLKNMVVPVVSRMFYIQGFGVGSWITNVVVSNLVIACVTAPINNGTADGCGEFYYPAVDFAFATNCAVSACSIYGCAGTAVGNHWATCQNVCVNNSAIHDIGASGVSFPGSLACTFTDNLIYNCGTLCQGGVGIWGSKATQVYNNVVTNITGSGIAISSGSYSDKSDGSLIKNNSVLRAVKQLRDMGAIYFWSCTN